jgi:hypothetical protein
VDTILPSGYLSMQSPLPPPPLCEPVIPGRQPLAHAGAHVLLLWQHLDVSARFHTVDDDDVGLALGCNLLSGLMQSRNDDTAEVVQEFNGRLGFSSSCEGRHSRLAPRTTSRPQSRWDFHCNLRQRPGSACERLLHPPPRSFINSLGCMLPRPCHEVSESRRA